MNTRESGILSLFLPYHFVLGGIAVLLVSVLTLTQVSRGADNWVYDTLIQHLSPPVSNDIIIIAVDQKSLAELGRWPWSRRIHAQLIDDLTHAKVKGIALNLGLSEPTISDRDSDTQLAQAIRRNGNVVLPIFVEPYQINGPIVETLPTSELVQMARLGHTDIAADEDGISRSAFLFAGLGTPYWPALALALWDRESRFEASRSRYPGLHRPAAERPDLSVWARDYQIMIPYVSPPDGFPQLSYSDVIKKRVDMDIVQDRWVIVGVTANGMGTETMIPGRTGLAGIYYDANVLNTLINNNAITPLSIGKRLILAALLAVLPLVFYRSAAQERFWAPLIGAAILTLSITVAMLYYQYTWFPPIPALIALFIIALGWLLRMALMTRHQAYSDPLTGLANRARLNSALEHELRLSARTETPLTLIVIDIDNFKQLNDCHGHDAGDRILQCLAEVLYRLERRPRDVIARLGGDEFAILLPGTSHENATCIAAKIHSLIAKTDFTIDPSLPAFTISLGFHTCLDASALTSSALFKAADTALYQAKQAGRNCTRSSESQIVNPSIPETTT